MLVWLPEQWGNLSPEAHWSHCWPTTPGRHRHWPDSGLHDFPYEPSCEQWQAVDRKQECREKQFHHCAAGVKTLLKPKCKEWLPAGFQNLIPNRLFLGQVLPKRKESACISRRGFLRKVADPSQGMSTTRFDEGLWENEDVRWAVS